jgi:hypothetical protein
VSPELFDLAALPVPAGLVLIGVAGLLTAIVNTMAGGGSLLILPLLVGLGLPVGLANGTMRMGVLVQSVAAVAGFHSRQVRDYGVLWRLAGPMMVGAGAGTWLATRIPDDILRPVFGGVLAAWAVVLVVRPGRFLSAPGEPATPNVMSYVGATVIGAYGGFLQGGVGFPLLWLLVSGLGYPVVRANGVKVALVLAYTLVSLPMFALAGQVAWREGTALALGSLLGGWIGSRWQIRAGANLVRWFVVVAVLVSGIAMLASAF